MKSPKDKPKQKPNRLTNDFKYVAPSKATVDPLGALVDYVEKDAKAFAKAPGYSLARAAYDISPLGMMTDGSNAIGNMMKGSNVAANAAMLALALTDAADPTELTDLVTKPGIEATQQMLEKEARDIDYLDRVYEAKHNITYPVIDKYPYVDQKNRLTRIEGVGLHGIDTREFSPKQFTTHKMRMKGRGLDEDNTEFLEMLLK